ncbi:hypothetical protein CC1G_14780 [Coprinopsis cinerea okayama7|uniref:CxC2-like cysteine cluster KDZ transposase-associated domain-containing protein n=1 Tax=Coprinopsis cinerea (strain Okayama-7 / 130 / ATCC MYA-4618 / FGSC 9003) TaxID=240176 RepID=D6RNU0_COPC7|nr:hypothetical protein CC1G_14780 [Coprinopsis cinerea okayama7\|eukprot:XP_002910802.1 hypothetical protein CC1G_14780 [Coprinopsis cinerea okayama7\
MAWLWQAGLILHLGHGGRPCPHYGQYERMVEDDPFLDEPAEVEDSTIQDEFAAGFKPKGRFLQGDKLFTIVHTNGLHTLPIRFCGCPDNIHTPEWTSVLQHRLYPATFKDVRTVFTFEVLDLYYMLEVECHSSTYQVFSLLRRTTNKTFPSTVPDRERELGRVGRQWLWLKERKWFGFGHEDRTPGDGEAALFCAACPQPGVNLPDDWKEDRRKARQVTYYTISYSKKDTEDVWLKAGEGFMTENSAFEEHLRTSHQVSQKPTCHEHKAAEDQWQVHKGCDVTGIGAAACMRHGAYAPGSVVNFQKGERQVNMDYAINKAFKTTQMEGITTALVAYDIACQYAVHFLERFAKSPELDLADDLIVKFVIGLFHVHGHKKECYPRYASTFMTGAAVRSGEILESLWEILNRVSGRTRVMGHAMRVEILDAVMADSNWKKLLKLVEVICKEWPDKWEKMELAITEFELLDSTVTNEQREAWTNQAKKAQRDRVSNPQAMDVYLSNLEAPKPLKQKEVSLMDGERSQGDGLGVTQWLSLGISIQESQCSLVAFIRRYKRRMTDSRTHEVARRREKILKDLASFVEIASQLFPEVDFPESGGISFVPLSEELLTDDEDEGEDDLDEESHSQDRVEAEYRACPLPSSLSPIPTTLTDAVNKEKELRVAQAENHLESIRSKVSRKSYLYRNNLRHSNTKVAKTRARETIAVAERELKHHCRVYEQARWALGRLHVPQEVLARFQKINPRIDLRVNTAIADPNARGQSSETLSWIWKTATELVGDRDQYLVELYRVNWLQAREKKHRWIEEITLVEAEMDWIPRFFSFQAGKWKSRAETSTQKPGHLAYAHRQAAMWEKLEGYARKSFTKLLNPSQSSTEQ